MVYEGDDGGAGASRIVVKATIVAMVVHNVQARVQLCSVHLSSDISF